MVCLVRSHRRRDARQDQRQLVGGEPLVRNRLDPVGGEIDATGPSYKTHFKRSDLSVTEPGTHVAKVYFADVDGNLILQATGGQVTF